MAFLCLLVAAPEPLQAVLSSGTQDPLPMPTGIPQTADTIADAELLLKVKPTAEADSALAAQALLTAPGDSAAMAGDSALVVVTAPGYDPTRGMRRDFNPNPSRAVWLSALCPGLGQVYNRRYWKLPIIIGGFMGLGYATSWNNRQLKDYTQAYRDIMDNDPATNSYMNFFPPTTTEDDLDKAWLQNRLRSRKDFYRRNRDLCIICMAGLYLLCMLDAYVDASLSHFDISPDLSMDLQPAMFLDPVDRRVSLGLNWAVVF